MRKLLVLPSLLLILGMSGCGASADGRVKNQIKAMNELAEAYEKKAPPDKIAECQKNFDEATKNCQDMNIPPEEFKKVMADNKDELSKATQRLFQANMATAFGDFKLSGGGNNNVPGAGTKNPAKRK